MWMRIAGLVLCTSVCCSVSAQTVPYFVDDSVDESGDGTTWATALKTLQEALAITSTEPYELRIAEGTYYSNISGRSLELESKHKGLVIRGGYRGGSGTNADDRDIDAFPTILAGNGIGEVFSYHVLTAIDINNDAHGLILIDGVTIQGGFADGETLATDTYGGGAYIFNSSVDFLRCTFQGNSAFNDGGGLYLEFEAIANPNPNDPPQPHATVRAVNCRFHDNGAAKGGGIANISGNLYLANCLIHDNSSEGENGTGAGLYNYPEGGTRIGAAWL